MTTNGNTLTGTPRHWKKEGIRVDSVPDLSVEEIIRIDREDAECARAAFLRDGTIVRSQFDKRD